MADKLHFSLVSPEREVFAGDVDHVVVPGAEGEFGVLPHHAPLMATVRPGALRVIDGGAERRIFVNGGFADVTPDGLTILAEDAVDLTDFDRSGLAQALKDAEEDIALATTDEKRAAAAAKLARLQALQASL